MSAPLIELVAHARSHSPFYRELYRDLPTTIRSILELPILNQDEFWAANSLESNRLLTGPMTDGIILKSGGTTGKPKFSVLRPGRVDAFYSHLRRKARSQRT